jgi:hypothetical protein
MASKDRRELMVRCGLGRTTLLLAQLSRTLIAVQSNPRSDFIRRREEIIGAPLQHLKTHIEITLSVALNVLKFKTKDKEW